MSAGTVRGPRPLPTLPRGTMSAVESPDAAMQPTEAAEASTTTVSPGDQLRRLIEASPALTLPRGPPTTPPVVSKAPATADCAERQSRSPHRTNVLSWATSQRSKSQGATAKSSSFNRTRLFDSPAAPLQSAPTPKPSSFAIANTTPSPFASSDPNYSLQSTAPPSPPVPCDGVPLEQQYPPRKSIEQRTTEATDAIIAGVTSAVSALKAKRSWINLRQRSADCETASSTPAVPPLPSLEYKPNMPASHPHPIQTGLIKPVGAPLVGPRTLGSPVAGTVSPVAPPSPTFAAATVRPPAPMGSPVNSVLAMTQPLYSGAPLSPTFMYQAPVSPIAPPSPTFMAPPSPTFMAPPSPTFNGTTPRLPQPLNVSPLKTMPPPALSPVSPLHTLPATQIPSPRASFESKGEIMTPSYAIQTSQPATTTAQAPPSPPQDVEQQPVLKPRIPTRKRGYSIPDIAQLISSSGPVPYTLVKPIVAPYDTIRTPAPRPRTSGTEQQPKLTVPPRTTSGNITKMHMDPLLSFHIPPPPMRAPPQNSVSAIPAAAAVATRPAPLSIAAPQYVGAGGAPSPHPPPPLSILKNSETPAPRHSVESFDSPLKVGELPDLVVRNDTDASGCSGGAVLGFYDGIGEDMESMGASVDPIEG